MGLWEEKVGNWRCYPHSVTNLRVKPYFPSTFCLSSTTQAVPSLQPLFLTPTLPAFKDFVRM